MISSAAFFNRSRVFIGSARAALFVKSPLLNQQGWKGGRYSAYNFSKAASNDCKYQGNTVPKAEVDLLFEKLWRVADENIKMKSKIEDFDNFNEVVLGGYVIKEFFKKFISSKYPDEKDDQSIFEFANIHTIEKAYLTFLLDEENALSKELVNLFPNMDPMTMYDVIRRYCDKLRLIEVTISQACKKCNSLDDVLKVVVNLHLKLTNEEKDLVEGILTVMNEKRD